MERALHQEDGSMAEFDPDRPVRAQRIGATVTSRVLSGARFSGNPMPAATGVTGASD